MRSLCTDIHCHTAPAPTSPRQADHPYRILIVDDEPAICALNVLALTLFGYQVEAVENGAVAWQVLQLKSYDLMITDNNMPQLSGLDLIKNVRAAKMALPVIMATGLAPYHEFDRNPSLQPNAILLKPYTVGELLETVTGVLGALDRAGETEISDRSVAYTLATDGYRA